MMSRHSLIFLLSAAVLSSALLVSCGTAKTSTATVYKTTPVTSGVGSKESPSKKTFEIPKSLAPQSQALLSEARKWLGTPYKYGGEDFNGVDCSGLVLKVYKSALDLKLPRNSADQAAFCSPIGNNSLFPGDLLFYNTSGGNRISHVGIYIGDGKMIHSSSSQGVVITDISTEYFRKNFAGAGCVDKYRSMIVSAGASPNLETAPKPTPVVSVSKPTQTVSAPESAGFTLTPVATLPAKKTASKPEPTGRRQVEAAAITTAVTAEEPTPDEARTRVLNSLIEQKLDSILSK